MYVAPAQKGCYIRVINLNRFEFPANFYETRVEGRKVCAKGLVPKLKTQLAQIGFGLKHAWRITCVLSNNL
jgi:hypothetical protein